MRPWRWGGIDPPWWWRPWIDPLAAIDDWWHHVLANGGTGRDWDLLVLAGGPGWVWRYAAGECKARTVLPPRVVCDRGRVPRYGRRVLRLEDK